MRISRKNLNIGKTILQIIAAQQFLIILKSISIIRIILQERVPPTARFGDQHTAQCICTKRPVTRKGDVLNFGFTVFRNHKRNIHAVVRLPNQLWIDFDVIKTLGLIKRQNPARIALNTGLCENHALLDFNFFLQSIIVNFAIAFKVDNIDQWIFNNANNDSIAAADDVHIRKQTRLKQRLDGRVNTSRTCLLDTIELQIGKHSLAVNALPTFNHDI